MSDSTKRFQRVTTSTPGFKADFYATPERIHRIVNFLMPEIIAAREEYDSAMTEAAESAAKKAEATKTKVSNE